MPSYRPPVVPSISEGGLAGNVPDARTVWAFREAFREHALTEALFDSLNQALAELCIELKSGQFIDATIVPLPIQRNGRESNALIKAGAVPIEWGQDADQPKTRPHAGQRRAGKTTAAMRPHQHRQRHQSLCDAMRCRACTHARMHGCKRASQPSARLGAAR